MSAARRPAAGVIFDLDGVIIDSEELQFRAYSEVLGRFGIRVSRAEYGLEWIARGRGPEYAVRTYDLPLSPTEIRRAKDPVYHELLRAEVALMPGAREALARMAESFPVALATNSSETDTGFVLGRFDLHEYFTAIVTRERYTGAKPLPDAFLTAAALLELEPSRCVVVEDAYKGVLAAHHAGCPCVAVPHGFTVDNDFSLAARIIDGLDQLTPDLVRDLAGRSAAS